MSLYGYHGRYLRIELPTGRVEPVSLDEQTLRHCLGGSGLGTHLMLAEDGAHEQSERGPIAFVFSPLVGSPLTTSAKFAVVCKSPLTNRLNDAMASSGFAIAGKANGCDAIVITGSAKKASVLVIDDGQVRLESAQDLWRLTTTETEKRLRASYPDGFEFAVIGPAGERQVRFASISHDGRHAGRGGSGAVLGAKRIKAIAVRGDQRCNWHASADLTEYSRQLSKKSFGPATAKYRELGTASNLLTFNRLNALPTRNFQQSSFEGAEQLSPETLVQTHQRTRKSCRACTIGCEHLYQLNDETPVRLEYENLFALGPLCGINDPQMVLAASRLCDEQGMDTISAGGTIAFAMECVQRGLLDADWLQFGDAGAMARALRLISAREGLGYQLAEGSRALATMLGAEAMRFAPQVKGMELPGYEPRTLQTMALGLAVGTRGADHNRSSAYEVDFSEQVDRRNVSDDAVGLAIQAEDRANLLDSLILCKFLRGVFADVWDDAASMLRMVTGWDVTPEELQGTVRNIIDSKKRFNILAGWTPAEDTLPDRFFDPLPNDSATLSRDRLQELVRLYNLQRGWTADGYLSSDG